MHWENRPVTNISPVPSQSELFSLRLHRYRCLSCCCEQAQWQGRFLVKLRRPLAGFSISPNAGLAARKRYLLLCNKKKKFATAAVLSSSVSTCIQGCTRRTHLRNCWERLNSDLLLNNFNFQTWLFLALTDKMTCILFFDILKNFFHCHWPEHQGSSGISLSQFFFVYVVNHDDWSLQWKWTLLTCRPTNVGQK